jgi:uncharacterized membrane protein
MRTRIQEIATLFSAAALAAGCGGGAGSSAKAPPAAGGPAPGAVVFDRVQDEAGNPVASAFATAVGANGSRQVIGFAAPSPGAPVGAAMWTLDAEGAGVTPQRLPPIAGNAFSAAFDVDEAGRVVGQSSKGERRVAVVWDRPGEAPLELPPLHAAGNGAAFAISPDGDLVVGEAQDATGAIRAVVWTADASGAFAAPPAVLPVSRFVAGGRGSALASANDVARVGAEIWVVGEVEDGAGIDHAVLWRSSDGVVFGATDLRGEELGSAAFGVSRAGVVVGEIQTSPGTFAPVRWQKDDAGSELRRVQLAARGSARAIDAAGRIAGTAGAGAEATVWSASGAPLRLFEGGEPSQAYAIVDGLVVGRRGDAAFAKRVE